jgi:hypothetical protein
MMSAPRWAHSGGTNWCKIGLRGELVRRKKKKGGKVEKKIKGGKVEIK